MIQNIFFLVAFVMLFLCGCGDSKKDAELELKSAESRMAELEAEESKAFEKILIDSVKNDLKDPDSAQIRNLAYYGTYALLKDGSRVKTGVHTICGEINSKNSFGGYTGFHLFNASLVWSSSKNELYDNAVYKNFQKDEAGPTQVMFMENHEKTCKERVIKPKE